MAGRRAGGTATDDEHVEGRPWPQALGGLALLRARVELGHDLSRLIRPWSNGSPLRKTDGTASTLRSSISSWNRAPSIVTWVMLGLSTLMRLSACTTSGQFWQVSEK
jgi:hypothetical protein